MKKLFVILILFGIAGSFYNSLQFGHYHIVEGNMLIYHAHPYHDNEEEEDSEQHEHSNFEFIILDQVANHNYYIFNNPLTGLLKPFVTKNISVNQNEHHINDIAKFSTKQFRAPPENN